MPCSLVKCQFFGVSSHLYLWHFTTVLSRGYYGKRDFAVPVLLFTTASWQMHHILRRSKINWQHSTATHPLHRKFRRLSRFCHTSKRRAAPEFSHPQIGLFSLVDFAAAHLRQSFIFLSCFFSRFPLTGVSRRQRDSHFPVSRQKSHCKRIFDLNGTVAPVLKFSSLGSSLKSLAWIVVVDEGQQRSYRCSALMLWYWPLAQPFGKNHLLPHPFAPPLFIWVGITAWQCKRSIHLFVVLQRY